MKLEEMLSEVEAQLHLLLEDLESAHHRVRNDVERDAGRPDLVDCPEAAGRAVDAAWARELEEFRVRSSAIRRLLARFGTSDRSTRRFMEAHVDDEWERLAHSFKTLRQGFAERVRTSASDSERPAAARPS